MMRFGVAGIEPALGMRDGVGRALVKVAVVGTITYDTIVTGDGRRISSLGGIMYNLLSFAYLDPDLTVCPIAWIGEDRREEFFALLAPHPNIELSGIHLNPRGTNENLLVYGERDQHNDQRTGLREEEVRGRVRQGESERGGMSEGEVDGAEERGRSREDVPEGSGSAARGALRSAGAEGFEGEAFGETRTEISRARVPPVSVEMITPFLDADAVLFNFISGRDCDAEVMADVREATDALVAMDVHSLSLGATPEGRRFPRHITGWQAFVRSADIVQCNALEFSLLVGENLLPERAFDRAARTVLREGARLVAVTLGERGSIVFERCGDDTSRHAIPPLRVNAVDTTGCGDTYGAAFLLEYLGSGDGAEAGAFASVAAGLCATASGMAEMHVVGRASEVRENRFGGVDTAAAEA